MMKMMKETKSNLFYQDCDCSINVDYTVDNILETTVNREKKKIYLLFV